MTKLTKKVAIIHDHLLYIGGAEKFLFSLLKIFPRADIYTAFANDKVIKKFIPHNEVFVSFYNQLPLSKLNSNLYKPFLFNYWENLNLDAYDLVLSSSHSYSAKSVIPPVMHISYIHTPPRYLYGEYNETQLITKEPLKTLVSPLLAFLRKKDYAAAQRPNILIANSKTVQQRIKKYYGRESTVIYPPIKIPHSIQNAARKNYFICVSRLVKQKGTKLAIAVCNKLKLRLLIVGEGAEKKYLRSIAGPTVEFRDFVADQELNRLYAGAKALIYCSIQEDFGMVPIEAMAHGVPVIAFNSGGVKETVIHKKTGIHFNEYTVEALIGAIKEFEIHKFSKQVCRQQAQKFSEAVFFNNFKKLLKEYNLKV